jgi:hypothetical protein
MFRSVAATRILEMIDPPALLQTRLSAADSGSAPTVYAAEGFWYDALDSLSRLIAASPENAELRSQRASLLEQVGLVEAAKFDKKQQP